MREKGSQRENDVMDEDTLNFQRANSGPLKIQESWRRQQTKGVPSPSRRRRSLLREWEGFPRPKKIVPLLPSATRTTLTPSFTFHGVPTRGALSPLYS